MNKTVTILTLSVFYCFCLQTMVDAAPAKTQAVAEHQAITQLENMVKRVNQFHHEARSAHAESMELPVFAEYFKLMESRTNHHAPMGGLLSSPNQDLVRKRMEDWSSWLHERFPIGEICVVDQQGQEHMRFADGRVELPDHFSDSEQDSPFFQPSFNLEKGQVHLSEPYMSPDLFHWVIAFTSPIVLENGEKPAFLHFEVPLFFYQTLISTKDSTFTAVNKFNLDTEEEGRYFIVTKGGLLIADSLQEINLEIKAERHPKKNITLPNYLPPERLEDYLPPLTSISKDAAFLRAMAEISGQEKGVVAITLDGVSYVLAFQKMADRPWVIAHLDPIAARGFWDNTPR